MWTRMANEMDWRRMASDEDRDCNDERDELDDAEAYERHVDRIIDERKERRAEGGDYFV
jgi:hypothetical protein